MSKSSGSDCPEYEQRLLFGLEFSTLTSSELVAEICRPSLPEKFRLMVTANVDHIARLRNDSQFQSVYRRAWVRTIDGFPVFAYSRFRGVKIPERVTGADIFPEILRSLSSVHHRPFFVVSSERTGKRIRNLLEQRGFNYSAVRSVSPPFGFELDERYSEELLNDIRLHGTTHLFFGVGCPKSEKWLDHRRHQLGALYAFAFGAGIDFYAGTASRAPKMVRSIGMEWVWRMANEPRRLTRRYLLDSWGFISAVKDDWWHSR